MQRIVLFAKRPRLGRVKTRLVPPLTPRQALDLYRAILNDQLRFLRSFRDPTRELELCLDDAWPDGDKLAGDDVAITLQGGGDLGARLARCAARAFGEGVSELWILGADAPTLPASYVRDAWEALRCGRQAVSCPATDGGYVLIGLARPLPALFREVPWGGSEVLQVTLERARETRIALKLMAPWYDVDRPEDLERLRADLGDAVAAARAPETARALARLPL